MESPGRKQSRRRGLDQDRPFVADCLDEFAPVPLLSASVSGGTRCQIQKMTAWKFHNLPSLQKFSRERFEARDDPP
jgi:hypothetical protein